MTNFTTAGSRRGVITLSPERAAAQAADVRANTLETAVKSLRVAVQRMADAMPDTQVQGSNEERRRLALLAMLDLMLPTDSDDTKGEAYTGALEAMDDLRGKTAGIRNTTSAPVLAQRPKQISRLGILLCGG